MLWLLPASVAFSVAFLVWAVPWTSSDPFLVVTMLLLYVTLELAIAAFLAEVFFNLSFGEHIVTWSFPAVFAYTAVVMLFNRILNAWTLAGLCVLPWGIEGPVAYWLVQYWQNHLDDHEYLYGRSFERHPRRLPRLIAGGTLGAWVAAILLLIVGML